MPEKSKIIVVLGPTASGKSDLAVEIARRYSGEIISADSRQVYRGMNIGTGKVPIKKCIISNSTCNISIRSDRNVTLKNQTVNCYKETPHYLLDVASPKKRFTVAQYKKLADEAIQNILKRGKIPIICGGTGFYIQAITENLEIPAVKPNLKLRSQLEKKSADKLFNLLKKSDPERAKSIDRYNKRRLIRAIEIVKTTGRPVPMLKTSQPYDVLFIGIKKSPEELKKMIAKRLQKRLKQGLIAEVKKLKRGGLSWKKLDDFGLEYRWIAKFLQKKIPPSQTADRDKFPRQARDKAAYQEMISRLQKEIEHFAKRQMTWFKKNKKIIWIKNEARAEKIIKCFLK